MWDPGVYMRFTQERGRPFADLVGQVHARNPTQVVDLGCGPGDLTATLAHLWPGANIVGIDSSPSMIDKARALDSDVRFEVGDLRAWSPGPDTCVVICNAALQWVDGHADLIQSWAGSMPPGSWLAFQVPGNFDASSHRALRGLARSPRWHQRLTDLVRGPDAVLEPHGYADLLLRNGLQINAWETTYLHLLDAPTGHPHPVLRWMEGTALRPIQTTLEPREWTDFRAQLHAELAQQYPTNHAKVAFEFRRVFAVAHVP